MGATCCILLSPVGIGSEWQSEGLDWMGTDLQVIGTTGTHSSVVTVLS